MPNKKGLLILTVIVMMLCAVSTPAVNAQAWQHAAEMKAAKEKPAPAPTTDTVYVTNTGKKYHKSGCRYLKSSSRPLSKADADKQGYTPCSVCKP